MERLEVQVVCTTGGHPPLSTRFVVDIDFGGGLTQREQSILFNSARNCETSKILTGNIGIDYMLKTPVQETYEDLETAGHTAHDGG